MSEVERVERQGGRRRKGTIPMARADVPPNGTKRLSAPSNAERFGLARKASLLNGRRAAGCLSGSRGS